MRKIDVLNVTGNSRVYKMTRRFYTLSCDRCPPNRKENWKRNHATKSWKGYRNRQFK